MRLTITATTDEDIKRLSELLSSEQAFVGKSKLSGYRVKCDTVCSLCKWNILCGSQQNCSGCKCDLDYNICYCESLADGKECRYFEPKNS